MKKYVIVVKEVVHGTSTNAEALPLFIEMDKAISDNKIIVLSLKSCPTMSSSFLNSSIGAIIDKYGFKAMTGKLTISDYTPVLANTITGYLNTLRDSVHS